MPLTLARDVKAGPVKLAVTVATQACDDKVCLAPEVHVLSLTVTVDPAAKAAAAAKTRHPSIFNAAP